MGLVNNITSWFLRDRYAQIDHFMNYPHDIQHDTLNRLLRLGSTTEFGMAYDFDSITGYNRFRERVPLHDYDSVKPYIDRMMQGEPNILWPGLVRWMAKSSGTTSDRSKFIPVTVEALDECHYRGSMDVLTAFCMEHPDTKLFDGKGIIIGGSHRIQNTTSGVRSGDLSAVLLQNMNVVAEYFRTPSLDIALMDEWESKIEKLARSTEKLLVTSISGVPTWTIMLIKKLFEITGKDNLADIWPQFELYIHGGVSFTPYRPQFNKLIRSSLASYYETYNASEGFFGFQLSQKDNDLLLHTNNGIFYEFIPAGSDMSDPFSAVDLSQVTTGVNYAMVITTNAGLWRYIPGDTIKFTSLKPYKFIISGRTRQFINAFGEEVIVENTDRAMAEVCHETGAIVSDYTAAPVYMTTDNRGAHQWLVEFEQAPKDITLFATLLDNALRKVNSDYDAKRYKDMALQQLILTPLPTGTFYNWLSSKGKLGGQHKVPRLSNDRSYIDDILRFV